MHRVRPGAWRGALRPRRAVHVPEAGLRRARPRVLRRLGHQRLALQGRPERPLEPHSSAAHGRRAPKDAPRGRHPLRLRQPVGAAAPQLQRAQRDRRPHVCLHPFTASPPRSLKYQDLSTDRLRTHSYKPSLLVACIMTLGPRPQVPRLPTEASVPGDQRARARVVPHRLARPLPPERRRRQDRPRFRRRPFHLPRVTLTAHNSLLTFFFRPSDSLRTMFVRAGRAARGT